MTANTVTNAPAASGAASAARAALAAFVLALAAYAVLRGQSVGWDLRNYHWYDAWAWWTGRTQDVAPAQLQSYFNPLLHVPFWLLAQAAPPRTAVFALALVQGANACLAFAIARLLLPPRPGRDWRALACAAVGALGSTQLFELGATMGDTLVSIGLLGAMFLALREVGAPDPSRAKCLAAGLCAGAMVGLKPACAPVAMGACVAWAFAAVRVRDGMWLASTFAVGAAAGVLVAGGAWFLHLWREFGNPLHPYFSTLFATEWRPPYPTGDARYQVHGLGAALRRPLSFVHEWRSTSELKFRDLRVPVLLLALPAWLALRSRAQVPIRRRVDAACVAFAVAYLAWLAAFGYYRYLAAWEPIAPAVVVAILATWTGSARAHYGVIAALALTTNPAAAPRVPFADAFLEQPELALATAPHRIVLLAGDAPIAYLAPGLGAQHAYVRISGNYAGAPLPPWRADAEIAARIDADPAPALVLHQAADESAIAPALARFGLVRSATPCERVASSWTIANEPAVMLCPVERLEPARAALARAAQGAP